MGERRRTASWVAGLFAVIIVAGLAAAVFVWIKGDDGGGGEGDVGGVAAPNQEESVPVLAYLLAPTNATTLVAGDSVTVLAQAAAADGVATTEVVVDGTSLGAVEGPEGTAEAEWLAWPAGVHTLQARAVDANGQTGQSPTLVVNVLAPTADLLVAPADGQRLEDIAAAYDLPAEIVTAANPQYPSSATLAADDVVRLPVAATELPPTDGDAAPPGVETTWTLRTTTPLEQTYCYVSNGGDWERIPSEPFRFLAGDGEETYSDIRDGLLRSGSVLESECWAWVGGVLTYLGGAETSDVYLGDPGGVTIASDAFTLVGQPEVSIPVVPLTAGEGPKSIPPPYAVRQTTDVGECTAHHGNLLAGFVCTALLEAPVQQFRILVWEWSSDQCWAGECVDDIDGYRVYQIPSFGPPAETLLADITNPGQQVLAAPLFFGSVCYGVQAYSDDPAIEASDITTFCPGDTLATETISLSLRQWMTTGGKWIQDGDCDTYGGASFAGLGSTPKVLVGSYLVDDEEEDCYREGHYDALVQFEKPVLPGGAVLQSAVLRFHDAGTEYKATAVALEPHPICASAVRRADADWESNVPASHWMKTTKLPPGPQIATVGYVPNVDVTSAVDKWLKGSAPDHGLVIIGRTAPHPLDDGAGVCKSFLDGFVLDLTFAAP